MHTYIPDPSSKGFSEPTDDEKDLLDPSDAEFKKYFRQNYARGSGTVFGPAATKLFLRRNNLELLVRSHEVYLLHSVVSTAGVCMYVCMYVCTVCMWKCVWYTSEDAHEYNSYRPRHCTDIYEVHFFYCMYVCTVYMYVCKICMSTTATLCNDCKI